MPVLQLKKISDHGKIGIWNIIEEKDELIRLLLEKGFDVLDIPESKNESHIKQWLAVRLLCYEFFNDYKIRYTDKGKPFLNNEWEISISHSGNYAAIIINQFPCGIDIEKISPKVDKIKHKFLNQTELDFIESSTDQFKLLTMFWSAKETLYKLYGEKELIFKDHLLIHLSNQKNHLKGMITTNEINQSYDMKVDFFNDYLLVYTI